MKRERIENAIKILDYAISNNVALTKASTKFGFADTYLKNTKRELFKKTQAQKNGINKSLFDEFFNLYEAYKTLTKKDVFDDLSVDTNKSKIDGESAKLSSSNDGNATFEWKGNYPPNHIKTLDDLLTRCNVDLDLWKVNDYVVNKWDVTSWKNRLPETIENFQVKARLVKKYDDENVVTASEIFNKLTKNYTPPIYEYTQKHKHDENNLLEISLFDLHLGKLGWSGMVNGDFNVEIATERFISSIKKLLQRAEGFNFNRILFPIGNDFLNSDKKENTTSGNTPQHEDRPWQETFNIATKLLVDSINLLKQTGVEVDVLVIPGNHDYERSFYLGSFLDAWFRNDASVNIDNGASPRKYYRYGSVLLGFTHGKYEKEASLPLLMASEMKEEWGKTEFHEWHLGHIHRKRNINYTVLEKNRTINEDLGVTVRYLSSLTGDEEWHHKNGFVGSTRAGEGFLWNDEYGLIGQVNSNII